VEDAVNTNIENDRYHLWPEWISISASTLMLDVMLKYALYLAALEFRGPVQAPDLPVKSTSVRLATGA
jgi:hypothetical protein